MSETPQQACGPDAVAFAVVFVPVFPLLIIAALLSILAELRGE